MRRRLMAARHGYACGNELKPRTVGHGARRKWGRLKTEGRKRMLKCLILKRMTPRKPQLPERHLQRPIS